MNSDLIYDIALTLQTRIGSRTAAHLLSVFGSARGIFESSAADLVSRAELNPRVAASLSRREFLHQAEAELHYCARHDILPVTSTSGHYPPLLRECPDYPHVLYFRGDPAVLGGRMLSIVGTRKMSPYGQKVCDRLIGELANASHDTVIVSGLAHGVDGAAHRAALSHGLRTVAVLPCCLPGVYPAAHSMLASEIVKKGGGLLTEYHSNSKNNGNNFIPRNRIIAGMSDGTLLVESPLKGGALITAGMADGYDRCLMAIPGRVGDMCSDGPNDLILRNKARMVRCGSDITRELMWDPAPTPAPAPYDTSLLSETSRRLLALIPDGESISIDRLADISSLSIPELSTSIFELEFEGAIRLLPGKRYERS